MFIWYLPDIMHSSKCVIHTNPIKSAEGLPTFYRKRI